MSVARHFLDTNILVYTFDRAAPEKAQRAEDMVAEALASGMGVISYQVAQEFIAVACRGFRTPLTFEQIERYWDKALRPLLAVHSSPMLFARAIETYRAHQLHWYDALIVAAALQANCKVLYSEDLQHGQRFGDLVVTNPFIA
jgi:predicted nucleic acid-binding protein